MRHFRLKIVRNSICRYIIIKSRTLKKQRQYYIEVKILKDGKQYFLYSKGAKIKLPITRSTDMDWVTFNSMDINNDKIPELFIFHEYFNSRDDEEYGQTHVYEIKNN